MPRKRKVYNALIRTFLKKHLRVQTESWIKDSIRVNEMELQTESIQILHRSEIDQKKGCVMTRDFLDNADLDFGLLWWWYIVNNTPQCARGKKHPGFFPSYISLFLGRSYRNKEGRHFRSICASFFQRAGPREIKSIYYWQSVSLQNTNISSDISELRPNVMDLECASI